MGGFSLGHWIIVLVIVLLVFGAGRLSDVGKGLGEGIKNFKKGLKEDEEEDAAPRVKRSKVIDTEAEESETPAPKQLTSGSGGKKKKVIQIEVDDDEDEAEVLKKIAAKKKAAEVEKDETA